MTEKIKNAAALSDKELVEGILANNEQVIHHFLYKTCAPMFGFIIKNIFDYNISRDELVNELYLFLQENDWRKLRQFDYRSKFMTWTSIVAIRFFRKKRDELIENTSDTSLFIEQEGYDTQNEIISKIDIENLLSKMTNVRYREVIHSLFIEETEPQQLADKMGVTVDNLYNIKRRAMQQLIEIIKGEQ